MPATWGPPRFSRIASIAPLAIASRGSTATVAATTSSRRAARCRAKVRAAQLDEDLEWIELLDRVMGMLAGP